MSSSDILSENLSPHPEDPDEKVKAVFGEIRREYLLAKYPSQIRGLEWRKDPKNPNDFSSQWVYKNPKRLYAVTVGQSTYQPPVQYRISFVKYVIKQLEFLSKSSQIEDHERSKEDEEAIGVSVWYDALEYLGRLEQTEPFYRLYEISKSNETSIIKIFENEASFVAEGTTGLVTWEASIEMTKWLNEQNLREGFSPKWIVELGCGCGFLAVSAFKIFPHLEKYFATDGSLTAVEKCKVNFEANFPSSKTDGIWTELIDWKWDKEKFRKIVLELTKELGGPGILLGADLVFDPALIPPLVNLIDIFLETYKPSPQTYLACTVRNDKTLEELKSHLEKTNKSVKSVYNWENGTVLKISTKQQSTTLKKDRRPTAMISLPGP